MVLDKAVDNLKEKPTEDKKVVAGGIAISVIVILLITWGFFFIKKIQRGGTELRIGGGAQEEFNFSNVRQAQEDIMKGQSKESELLEARQQAGERYGGTDTSGASQGEYQDPFGGAGGIE